MVALPDYGVRGYRVDGVLGINPEGGRTAYRGVRLTDGHPVVIKRFSFAGSSASWDGYREHERELSILRSLAHPRIPAYRDEFQTEDGFCLVQDFCAAPPMSARRNWSFAEVERIARSALEVLVYLQDRLPPVIHRDLKPENLLVDGQGNAHFVDFGLARADRARATTMAVGTPGFMSPEQMWGQELSLSSDLYALGAVLITAVTGTASTDVGSLLDDEFRFDVARLPSNLDPRFRAWLLKLVAPARAERFASARDALAALDAVRSSPPVAVAAAQPATPAASRSKRKGKQQKPPGRGTASPTPPDLGRPPPPGVPAAWLGSRKRRQLVQGVVIGGLAAFVVALGVWSELSPSSPESDREAAARPIRCQGTMTIAHDLSLEQQLAPVTTLPGCDLTISNAKITGVVGIHVKGGTVRLEGVTVQTQHPAIDVDSPQATVFVARSKLSGDGRGLMVREGLVTVEDSEISSSQLALDAGARVVVRRSKLVGGTAALALHSAGEATLIDSTLESPNQAVRIWNGQGTVHFEGGRVVGAIASGGGAITGLDSVEIELGPGAEQTWTDLACAPIGRCLEQQPLGEYIVDARVSMGTDGALGTPEFLQKKLEESVEECIVLAMQGLVLPGPDGRVRTVRCTSSGQRFAGGATMGSTDFRVEQ